MITIGIDPHKRSLTAAALDSHSRLLGQLRVLATSQAGTQLLDWAVGNGWPQRRWAVEGASGLGRGIAQLLVTAGEQVVVSRPSWPPGPDCCPPAAPARATWPTPARSPRLPSITAAAPGHPRGPDGDLAAAV